MFHFIHHLDKAFRKKSTLQTTTTTSQTTEVAFIAPFVITKNESVKRFFARNRKHPLANLPNQVNFTKEIAQEKSYQS